MLVVENSEDDALLLLRELKHGGYETESERVQTPEAMRKALAASSWDVILSDYRMPRFSAVEALELAREAGSEAPFIVVSGRIGEDVAVEAMRAGAYDYVMKDNLARLCATVGRGLQEMEERRERRRAEQELRRREAILDAVRFAADQFLGEAVGWEESVRAVLGRLGEATGASRAYIFENHTGEDGEVWATQRYEWVATGVSEQIENPLLKAISYRAAGFGRWLETLGRGDLVRGYVRDFPESEQPELRAEEILSIAIVPIFVEGRWWGFIGFDECCEEREWSAAEVSALGAAAGTLGAAIRRRQMEGRLRQSEARYRAVVEQATDGIYILDAETRRFIETNPSFQRMFGYAADELQGMEIYDIVAHPREDVDATINRTLKRRRRIVGERKYRRKDGALLDVEVGVSVISLDGRDVICTIVRDVTGRKKNEAALRENEARFKGLVEATFEGVAITQDGKILETNAAFAEMFGYAPAEVIGMTPLDVTAPEDHETVLSARASGLEEPYEALLLKKDGTTFDSEIRDKMSPYKGRNLRVTAIRDVTERKKAEEALKESERLYRAVVEQATENIFLIDVESRRIVESNRAFRDALGYSEEELDHMTLYDVVAADRESIDDNVRRILEQKNPSVGERQYVRKDGTLMEVEVSAGVILREGRHTLVGVAHDITERKRNEEALRESQRALATLMSNLPGMAYRCRNDPDWTMEFVSEGCVELTGYSPSDLIGNRRTAYADLIHPDDREAVWDEVQAAVSERRPFQFTYRITTASGAMKWVWEQGRGVFSPDGELLALEGFVTDTTEQARAQQLLEERVTALSNLAASLTLDLPVQDTLDAMARSVIRASTAVTCSVSLIDEATGFLRMASAYGLPRAFKEGIEAVWREDAVNSPTLETVRRRKPLLAYNMRRRMLENPLYGPVHDSVRDAAWDTVFILPLVSRGRALGALNFSYLPGQEPGETERVFLSAVADQVAIAVENARLFSEARGKAALEERQKLARELHDSVSQALYGIALGVETARELLPDDPESAAKPLDYAVTLAEAGMTEMRALIFELRPESLEKEGLVAALEKQAAAVQARHGIRVEAAFGEEPEMPLEAKESLYRIAQEALHNTVKHARASSVEINLERNLEGITLEISDDGAGFEARGDFPGHLGLKSMRERAARLGGALEVGSAPGEGTRIRAWIPL